MNEIFTYGNGVMLAALFDAIAAMTKTDDYLKLIKVVFTVTIVVVAFEIGWTGRFKPTARLFGIIILLQAAILMKVDIKIFDRVNPSNDTTVEDVPAGIAVPLAYATAIGDWAADAFESAFSLPNELRFRTHGMLFPARLVEASTRFEIPDSRLANNMAEFAEGCMYYGAMAGWFSLDDLMTPANIWAALPATSFGNAVFIEYENASGVRDLQGCRDARDLLNTDWNNAMDGIESFYGLRLFPGQAEATAKANLVAVLPQSYSYLANISSNAADIIRQNAMINLLTNAFTRVANNAGAMGAAQDFALAQAEAQQRTTYATLGALAGRMMSLFRNVLETLIYGIFPIAIVFVMISLMQGKALLMYFKLLFWLQLWPPMYAILHFAMMTYGAESVAAAATQPGGGTALTMLTQTALQSANSDMSAMAGYLAWMIPMFSWALVSGSGFAASQMAASLGSVAQSAGSSAARDVSTGNISLGNYSAYNGGMFQTNTSPSLSRGLGTQVDSITGTTRTTTAGGYQFQTGQQTTMPFTAQLGNAVRSSVQTTAAQKVEAARNAAREFGATTASTYSNMSRLGQTASSSQSVTSGAEKALAAQYKSDMSRLNRILDRADFGQGLTRAQKAAIMLGGKFGVGGQIEGVSGSNIDWKKAQEYAKQSGFQEAWSNAQSSSEKLATQLARSSGDSSAKEIAGGFQQQRAARASLQSSLSEAQAWQRLSSQLSEQGGNGSLQATAALIRYGNAQLQALGAGVTMEQLAAQSASTSGDAAAATRRLQGIIGSFIQNEARSLAGVGDAPSRAGVDAAHAANTAAVDTAANTPEAMQAPGSGSVKAHAAGTQSAIEAEAEQRGVPDAGSVDQAANEIRDGVHADMNSTGATINQGQDEVKQRGGAVETSVKNATTGSPNHLKGAVDQFNAAGADSISNLNQAIMNLTATRNAAEYRDAAQPPSAYQSSDAKPQGEGPNGDLPPLEWFKDDSEGSTAPQAPGGGVGNPLR